MALKLNDCIQAASTTTTTTNDIVYKHFALYLWFLCFQIYYKVAEQQQQKKRSSQSVTIWKRVKTSSGFVLCHLWCICGLLNFFSACSYVFLMFWDVDACRIHKIYDLMGAIHRTKIYKYIRTHTRHTQIKSVFCWWLLLNIFFARWIRVKFQFDFSLNCFEVSLQQKIRNTKKNSFFVSSQDRSRQKMLDKNFFV